MFNLIVAKQFYRRQDKTSTIKGINSLIYIYQEEVHIVIYVVVRELRPDQVILLDYNERKQWSTIK